MQFEQAKRWNSLYNDSLLLMYSHKLCFVAKRYILIAKSAEEVNRKCSVIGRIHGAIIAATRRSDRRGDCRGDDRLVYTLQAIVAATIASWLLD